MSRYNLATALRNQNQKRYLSTIIFPVVPLSDSDIFIQTTSTERLDKLADSFYDNVSLWWVIAAANGLGKGTYVVPQNTRLRIPDQSTVQNLLIEINTSR